MICKKCKEKRRDHDMWTEQYCKYCWQKEGKTIYSYQIRDTTQYRKQR